MIKSYDVVIVGGGPSGATIGTLLQKKNHSVCIIDKAAFPRDKLCGGLITWKSMQLYEKVFGTSFLSNNECDNTINCITICDIVINEYNKKTRPYTIVDRMEFDSKLIATYRETGGCIYENAHIKDISYENNTIELRNNITIHYRILIGADGVYSIVRKHIDKKYMANGIGFEAYISKDLLDIPSNQIRLLYKDKLLGYGWIFPRACDIIIGFGGLMSGNVCQETLQKLLETFNITAPVKGMHIPFGNFVRVPVVDNVFLIGDAAGLANPITGEGIFYSGLSAKYAAIGANWILKKKPGRVLYRLMITRIHMEIRILTLFRPLFYCKYLRNLWFSIIWKRSR